MKFQKILLLGALCLVGIGVQAEQTASVSASSEVSAVGASKQADAIATGSQALNKTDVDAWLDGYMPYALHSGDIPGAVVVVVKDGQILTARGFGYANVEKRTPVDPERTLFRPGSVSKLVTWTAVMQMVEQKKLDLDHDVNDYLDFKIPPRAGAPITLRQIMTHTAGFEETIKSLIYYDASHNKRLGDVLKTWVPERIFDAGTTPAYSNYATALAGYMVERASGEPFEEYVEKHIFAPLGMHNASFRQPLPESLAAQMATGYDKTGKVMPGFEIVGPGPAGALSASGVDMGRFMIAHLQNGELDGKRILSAETAATMHDSPLSSVNPMSLIPPLNRMELGFFETNINGREVIGHLGDTVAFHTSLHLFMKDGVGFYVSFNSAGKAGAVGTLRGTLFQDFADRYFPNAGPQDGRVDPKTAAEHAHMISGVWVNSRGSESSFFSILGFLGQSKVEVGSKGELVVPALVGPNGRPREWAEIAPFVWRDKNGHDRLAAKVVDGQVVRWSMDFMSPFMVFDRAPAGKSGTWLKPALYASLAVLLLTFLAWPIGWVCRRKYKLPMTLTGSARSAALSTQILSGLSLLVLGGWAGTITAMLGNLQYATGVLDPLLWVLQLVGAASFVAAVLASAWNLKLTWSDGRGRARKFWSALIVASTLVVLYVALCFGLISFTVNY
jgi:CubicO group peptidase (beta-lactamase class C family)